MTHLNKDRIKTLSKSALTDETREAFIDFYNYMRSCTEEQIQEGELDLAIYRVLEAISLGNNPLVIQKDQSLSRITSHEANGEIQQRTEPESEKPEGT